MRTREIHEQIAAIKPGAFVTLEKRLPHGGSLQARHLATGVAFYWRFGFEGKTHREPIGIFDRTAPPKKKDGGPSGYSVAAALEKCRILAERHGATIGGLHASKADETRRHAVKLAADVERGAQTFAALFGAYVALLRARGRERSAYDAENLFRHHVVEAFPKIAAMPAADLSADDIVDLQRGLIDQGKGRTSNKMRSYLRAAFQTAVDARVVASIPVRFKDFGVSVNPAAATKRDAAFDRADKRPLLLDDLRAYWRIVKVRDGIAGAAMRLHLLTGGQRVEQILRLKWADVGPSELAIYDGKGRPGQAPRRHTLPIVAPLRSTIDALARNGDYVLSTDGAHSISASTLAGWTRDAVGDQIAGFQLKRIRSGVETLLAENGVSREIRGHVQSHGLTGVQAKHYDDFDYMAPKRAALELLLRLLDSEEKDNVVRLKKGGRRKAA